MSGYLIKEVFYTIQGEGYWTGRPAVFCRFARCNLWTGREEDRPAAACNFCDTDFTGGERIDRGQLVESIFQQWPTHANRPMVVFTGGEPLLQLDEKLVFALRDLGFYIAVETNGTMPVPNGVDWVCVSPKVLNRMVVPWAHELKLVYPQVGIDPDLLVYYPAEHHWLSPMDGPNLTENTASAVEYVKHDPRWRLNIQTHKVVGVR